MKQLVFTLEVLASREKLWECLWEKTAYSTWTAAFCEGSYYEGTLEQGSKVHLLTPNGDGMYSTIKKRIEYEELTFEHLGDLIHFEEIPTQETAATWTGALESYSLETNGDKTVLTVRVDVVESYIAFMERTFPNALANLKKIAEA